MQNLSHLSWNERFAIIDHFRLDDEIACKLFQISQGKLTAARVVRKQGRFAPPDNFNFDKFKPFIERVQPDTPGFDPAMTDNYDEEPDAPPPTPKAKKDTTQKESKRTPQKPSNRTTQKPKKPPQKRGRKTHKIKDAYEAIPRDPAPVEDFMAKHNVSLSVLRRHKNFDHIPETGQVNVRKVLLAGQTEKVLCIWRGPSKE